MKKICLLLSLIFSLFLLCSCVSQEQAQLEKNKAIVKKHMLEFHQGKNLNLADELIHDNIVLELPKEHKAFLNEETPKEIKGKENYLKHLSKLTATSSFKFKIKDMIAEKNKVIVHLTTEQTFKNGLKIPEYELTRIYELLDNKIIKIKIFANTEFRKKFMEKKD